MNSIAKPAHVLQQTSRSLDHLLRRGCFRRTFLDQRFPADDICSGIEKHAFRFQAVAPCTAGLLLVVLDGFRHRGMDHSTNVAAINAHSKSDGGNDDIDLLGSEGILSFAAFLGVHTCVIKRSAHPAISKRSGKIFGVLAADAVNDRSLSLVALQYFENLSV